MDAMDDKQCLWVLSADRMGYTRWDTDCGRGYNGEDISPTEFIFCPHCGKKIAIEGDQERKP